MNKLILFIILLSTTLLQASQIDEISRSVVYLQDNLPVKERINDTEYEVWLKIPSTNAFIPKLQTVTGTGLIVISSNLSYLITAKHVATRMTPQCEIVMRGTNVEPIRFKLGSITGPQRNLRWFHHAFADVSVYPLPSVTSEGIKALQNRAFPLGLLDSETNAPCRDVLLTVLGFPLGLGAEGEFIPLCRESKVASGRLKDGQSFFFLLQDPSVSGYSGGPLMESGDPRIIGISMVSGGTRCWGFVSGTYADETGGKMTKVVPAYYAVELVRQAEATFKIISIPEPLPAK